MESQRWKLRDKSWATTVEITAVAEDGRLRAVTAIDLDTTPMCLAGIDERKVSADVRPKLARYQWGVHQGVSRPTPEATADRPSADTDPLLAQLDALRELRVRQLGHERQLAAITARTEAAMRTAERAVGEAEAARQTTEGRFGYFTLLAYAKCKRRLRSAAPAGVAGTS